jgi:putative acetyltransferase
MPPHKARLLSGLFCFPKLTQRMIDMSDLKFSIRRAVSDDAKGFCELMENESVFSGLFQMPFPTESAWKDRIGSRSNEGDLQLVAVSEGKLISTVGVVGNQRMRRRHSCLLGIAVIGPAQGKGVGTAMMKAITEYADKWTTFTRIELTVFADNTNAISLYKKFGFEEEGLLRHYALRNGRFDDVISMARFNPNQAVVQ